MLEGDLDSGIFAAGQAVGLINDIKPAKQVIDDMIMEAELIMKRLNGIYAKQQ
jgi:NAD(P)H-dependent flavin oxidoreductase YrpB (nitropropane dioxygenase family)